MPQPSRDAAVGQSDDSVTGCEWIIDAGGCAEAYLRSRPCLEELCDRIVNDLGLHVVGLPLWRSFPEPGGVTGLYLLSESHLACHSWPEHGVVTFNLFCCRRRQEWPWDLRLRESLLARHVVVRVVERGAPALLCAHPAVAGCD